MSLLAKPKPSSLSSSSSHVLPASQGQAGPSVRLRFVCLSLLPPSLPLLLIALLSIDYYKTASLEALPTWQPKQNMTAKVGVLLVQDILLVEPTDQHA